MINASATVSFLSAEIWRFKKRVEDILQRPQMPHSRKWTQLLPIMNVHVFFTFKNQ